MEKPDSSGHVTKKLEFSVASRGGNYFPFGKQSFSTQPSISVRICQVLLFELGGGASICAGRNFAKPEILLAVAIIISNFDIKFVQWLKHDGTCSERPALDNTGYANAVATPPDREMKVLWRRI